MHAFQLFIQACNGDDFDPGYSLDETDGGNRKKPLTTHADIIIFRASFPGYVSWRRGNEGSYFIQELTKVVKDSGRNVDLDTIIKRTTRAVTQREAKYEVCSKTKFLFRV